MSFPEFLHLAQECGFVHTSTVGSAIVIPPRYVVLNVATTNAAHGLRWMLFGKVGNLTETRDLMVTAVNENSELRRHAVVRDLASKMLDYVGIV